MQVSSRFALGMLALALWGGAGCKRETKTYLEKVKLELSGEDDGAILGFTTAQVQEQVEQQLGKRGFVVVKKDGPQLPKDAVPWRLSMALIVEPPNSQVSFAQVRAVALLERQSDGQEHEVQVTAKDTPKGEGLDEARDAARTALEVAVGDAALRLGRWMSLDALKDDEVVAKLSSADEVDRELAVRVLAERKNPAAVDALVKRLNTDDLNEARRAMGLLLQVGDRRAVPAIIEVSNSKDLQFQREVVFALGALGGDEAEAYLTLMAEGHDQPLMRLAAQTALDEMKGRRDGGR